MRFRSAQRISLPLLCLVVVASLLGTACFTRTQQYSFEVRKGASIEERLQNARALATEERLARLKRELRDRHPDLTDAQLGRIGIRWTEKWSSAANGGKADRSVLITVIMEERAGADTGAVVMTAAKLLDAEINGPDHR